MTLLTNDQTGNIAQTSRFANPSPSNQMYRRLTHHSTHSRAKEYLIARGYLQNSPMTLAFVASLGSGVLCVLIETPLDVANTRLYNQGKNLLGYLNVLETQGSVKCSQFFMDFDSIL